MRRLLWLSVVLALVIAYPLLFSTPFQQRLGRAGAALCDRSVGLEHCRRLCRPGIGRPCRVLRLRRLCCDGRPMRILRCRRWWAFPSVSSSASPLPLSSACRPCGCLATISAWPRSRSPNWSRLIVTNTDYLGAGCRSQRADRAAQRVRSLVHFGAAILLSVPGGSGDHARHHLVDGRQPDGVLSARHQGFRACGAFAGCARQPHQALCLHAERRA